MAQERKSIMEVIRGAPDAKIDAVSFARKQTPKPPSKDPYDFTEHDNPEVGRFIDQFVASGKKLRDQKQVIEHLQVELEKWQARDKYADMENARIGRERDAYRAQYNELKIGVEVVVTSAIAACDSAKRACDDVIDKARALLNAVHDSLAHAGVSDAPPAPECNIEPNFEAELIGKHFGPTSDNKGE